MYAEAYVHVNQYDIVLDVLVVNQTSDTLQNCTLELATLGEGLPGELGFHNCCQPRLHSACVCVCVWASCICGANPERSNPTGDLKLVEKPSPLTLAPHDFANIKANVKVASTENGIIFGNIGEEDRRAPEEETRCGGVTCFSPFTL